MRVYRERGRRNVYILNVYTALSHKSAIFYNMNLIFIKFLFFNAISYIIQYEFDAY